MPMTSFKILFSPFHIWTRSFASRCWTSLRPYSTSNWIRILEHVPSQRELLELKREVSSILRSSWSDSLVRFKSSEIRLTSLSWSNLILSTSFWICRFLLRLEIIIYSSSRSQRCDIDNEMIRFAMRYRTNYELFTTLTSLWTVPTGLIITYWPCLWLRYISAHRVMWE